MNNMPTIPHHNTNNGYSLRVSKKLPENAANLAYVEADTPSPEKNLLIDDVSSQIPENQINSGEQVEYEVFTQDDMKVETEKGQSTFSRPDINITDEYAVQEENLVPLYYKAKTRRLFDARLSLVSVYQGGRFISNKKRFESIPIENNRELLYFGEKIVITKRNGIPLDEDEKYKIKLLKSGEESFTYEIIVYANFDYKANSYEIHYPYFNGSRNINKTEILNFTPIFEKISKNVLEAMSEEEKETAKKFAIQGDSEGGYQVYAPNPSTEFSKIDISSRPAHTFSYSLEAFFDGRVSDSNPVQLNVGIIYINDTRFGKTPVFGAGKKLFQNNSKIPDYVSFDNPHRQNGANERNDTNYWVVDITMPEEHYLDYDLLIMSGYGFKDFSNFNNNLKKYLDKGGTLILDNCGEGSDVLSPISDDGINTFINSISFSQENEHSSIREYQTIPYQERFYPLHHAEELGQVAPVLLFTDKEASADWANVVEHHSEGPSIIQSKNQYNGNLVISNAGLMLDIIFSNRESIEFMTNFIIHIAEKKFIKTPSFNEFVYHRDNLFTKEYRDLNGSQIYYDDKHDIDRTQIVAKKSLSPSIKEKFLPYLPPHLKKAEGEGGPVVESDGFYEIANSNFEQSPANKENRWTSTTIGAIPSWDVVKFAGDSVAFEQVQNSSQKGKRAIKIETNNAQAFWESDLGYLPIGEYELNLFARSNNSENGGFGLYTPEGELFKEAEDIEGSSNWTLYKLAFNLSQSTPLLLRLGTHRENGSVSYYFDNVQLRMSGSVMMNRDGNLNEMLYAFATSPKGEGLDLSYRGLKTEDVSIENVMLNTRYQIKSYVYQWDNTMRAFKKVYGNAITHPISISKGDGLKELGNLISLIPEMNDGAPWADKTKVYYEISPLDTDENKYINYQLYDPSIQKLYFNNEGKIIINYNDLRYDSLHSTVMLRAITDFTGLHIVNRKYNLSIQNNRDISVDYPATKDERDRWYLRVKNGSFFKDGLTVSDMEELEKNGRLDYYKDNLFGEHEYSIPEYFTQPFYPQTGERQINAERAQYYDPHTITIERTPLLIREEEVVKEALSAVDSSRSIFQAQNIWWNKDTLPTIYWDELSNGQDVIITDGYEIDYENGQVRFKEESITNPDIFEKGIVKASYVHDNFKIFNRKYQNQRRSAELLTTRDGYTFHSENLNWMTEPQPTLYRNYVSNKTRISPHEFYIDYENGSVVFFNKVKERIYVDYGFYTEEEMEYTDVDSEQGIIKLEQEIDFKSEIYVNYVYQEDYYEYKGYYDEDTQSFIHLDLNPTTGHTYTQRQVIDGETEYIDVPTEKLLGKEIYFYLVPSKSTFGESVRGESHCLRHALSEEEWQEIKKANVNSILLAKIQVRENTDINNLVVMDARKHGGGIKEDITQKEIENITGDVSSFWDIGNFDGHGYYRNGVSILTLPETVLKEYGGQFTEEDIYKIIARYNSYGNMVMPEYVKVDEPQLEEPIEDDEEDGGAEEEDGE